MGLKYPATVHKARFEAAESGEPQVVYQYKPFIRVKFGYTTQAEFDQMLIEGKYPMVRLLLCMPDGAVAQ